MPHFANLALPPTTTIIHGVISPSLPAKASPLWRCDAEIATGLTAVITGTLPLQQALLYYCDWCRERLFILSASTRLTDQPKPAAHQFSRGKHQ